MPKEKPSFSSSTRKPSSFPSGDSGKKSQVRSQENSKRRVSSDHKKTGIEDYSENRRPSSRNSLGHAPHKQHSGGQQNRVQRPHRNNQVYNSAHNSNYEHNNAEPSQDLVRINKALADAGICSRRKAEELILAGKVFVNGLRIDNLGHKVGLHDEIRVDGKKVVREEQRSYLMFHKPVQTLCTAHDPEGRQTIFDILPAQWRQKRLFTVGRLDYFSEGLLLLTDDGHFAQHMAHPRYHLPKIYEVWVRENVYEEQLDLMRRGMTLEEGEKLAPVQVRILRKEARSTLLEMTLHQGINRQIRRMCRDLHLTILQLMRVAQGPIDLDISAGKVRELSAQELKALRKAVGL